MDFWVGIAINVFLQLLASRKDLLKNVDGVAKVYVRITKQVEINPSLAAAVERQRQKGE